MKVHLDTDLGGDIDDLCALAMLLCRPDVELTGVTTVCENDGRRAGYTRFVLDLEGRSGVPVAAGAEGSLGVYRETPGLPPEENYWPHPIPPLPGPLDAALDLIKASVDQGALLIAVGAFTNLYYFDERYPGYLENANLVLMGGYIYPPRPGYPRWGNDFDYNVQVDVRSARRIIERYAPLLVPLSVTVETALCFSHLPALRDAGPLGRLIARQAQAFAAEYRNAEVLAPSSPRLPAGFINFLHDPLACAVALGWREGVEIAEIPLVVEERDGWLVERVDPRGRPTRVVTRVDGPAFDQSWLRWVTGGANRANDANP